MSFNAGNDLCLGFWAEVYHAGVVDFPPGATVLEIGCAEADWIGPMHAAQPDLWIHGIDWRACERPQAQNLVKGDVLTALWPMRYFDAIVSVSAIEHIGLGSYENDPRDPDGDTNTMQRACEWLKPGGWMYLDVPYRRRYETCSNFRAYDEAAIASRLVVPGFRERWRKIVGEGKGDGPYIALVLEKV